MQFLRVKKKKIKPKLKKQFVLYALVLFSKSIDKLRTLFQKKNYRDIQSECNLMRFCCQHYELHKDLHSGGGGGEGESASCAGHCLSC